MPDMSEFNAARPKPKTKLIETILEELAKSDKGKYESLIAALRDTGYSCRTIQKVLNGWGYEIGDSPIKSWRRDNA